MLYYEALDLVIEAITKKCDQPGYRVYRNLEDLILKACRGQQYSEQLDLVCCFYQNDLDRQQLHTQLLLSLVQEAQRSEESELTIYNIVKILSDLSPPQQLAFSQVLVAMKLLLVMPATNACSERSFSALRRLKTHLRATMSQQRLNSLLLTHIHKHETDSLDLAEVGNEFVSISESRLRMFGKFK